MDEKTTMDDKQKAKMERYLMNASPFLWGLAWDRPRDTSRPQNQEQIYGWLNDKLKNFNVKCDKRPFPTYYHVTRDLMQKYGIEKILGVLIIPQVDKIYDSSVKDYLRERWNAGELPLWYRLTKLKVWKFPPFLDVNEQYQYIAGWGVFAGLWFEEIEPIRKQLCA